MNSYQKQGPRRRLELLPFSYCFNDSRLGKLVCQLFLLVIWFVLLWLDGFLRIWGLDTMGTAICGSIGGVAHHPRMSALGKRRRFKRAMSFQLIGCERLAVSERRALGTRAVMD